MTRKTVLVEAGISRSYNFSIKTMWLRFYLCVIKIEPMGFRNCS